MRVLVVCIPAAGHVTPLVPLLRSLHDNGDEVVVATAPAVADTVEAAGARLCPVGAGLDGWFGSLAARTRGQPGDGLPPDRIEHYFVPRLFAEIAAADMVDGALAAGRELRPDLVLFDTEAFAGPLVAELLDVPAVHQTVGPLLAPDVLELANDAVTPLWRSFGRPAPRHAGLFQDLTLTTCPPSLEVHEARSGEVLGLRPTPLPTSQRQDAARPLVYVTLGTLWNDDPSIFRAVLDGLAAEPVDVLVTVGSSNDPAALEPVPSNARVERFVPQAQLLPRCAAVVHHAGAGTMFGALAHGLPQLALPRAADNFINADRLERAGAGRVLLPAEVTADNVRAGVKALLGEPAFAAAATRVAAEIAAMPSAEEVATTLRERYGAAGGPRR